jgi:hypothetical protein
MPSSTGEAFRPESRADFFLAQPAKFLDIPA